MFCTQRFTPTKGIEDASQPMFHDLAENEFMQLKKEPSYEGKL
jgi:hypothetical protein